MYRLLLVLKDYPDTKEGQRVRIECSDNGKPLEKKWRRRLKEAKRDDSCEWITPKTVKKRQAKEARQRKRSEEKKPKMSDRMQKDKQKRNRT